MKTELDIQHAHDLLVGILLEETPFKLTAKQMKIAGALAGVLCWCLDHEHNRDFGDLIHELEGQLARAGYVLSPDPKLSKDN